MQFINLIASKIFFIQEAGFIPRAKSKGRHNQDLVARINMQVFMQKLPDFLHYPHLYAVDKTWHRKEL
jgi:hypothetical protein